MFGIGGFLFRRSRSTATEIDPFTQDVKSMVENAPDDCKELADEIKSHRLYSKIQNVTGTKATIDAIWNEDSTSKKEEVKIFGDKEIESTFPEIKLTVNLHGLSKKSTADLIRRTIYNCNPYRVTKITFICGQNTHDRTDAVRITTLRTLGVLLQKEVKEDPKTPGECHVRVGSIGRVTMKTLCNLPVGDPDLSVFKYYLQSRQRAQKK